jgi:hypothetical protein
MAFSGKMDKNAGTKVEKYDYYPKQKYLQTHFLKDTNPNL